MSTNVISVDAIPAGEISRLIAPTQFERSAPQTMVARVVGVSGAIVFGSLLFLIVLVAVPYGTVEAWWISLFECAVFTLGGIWIGERLLQGSWNLKDKALLVPLLALTGFIFLQSLTLPGAGTAISADPYETRLLFFKMLALAVTFVLLSSYLSTPRRLHVAIHTILFIAVVSALFGIARQALQTSDLGFVLPYLKRDSGFGQFVNKNHFALLMEMAIGLATGLIFGGGVKRNRILIYVAAIALLWTALILTSSRGGLLSALAQIVFLTVLLTVSPRKSSDPKQDRLQKNRLFRKLVPAVALGAGVLMIAALSAIWLGGDLLVTRFEAVAGEIRAEAGGSHAGVKRREVWAATAQLIKTHPIVGTGFGAFGIAITKFHDGSGKWTPEAAHNDYLELVAAGGLVGVGLVLWFAVVFVKRARRQLAGKGTLQRAAAIGSLTGIFGVMVHSNFDFGLHVTINAVVFMSLIIFATTNFQLENNDVNEASFVRQLTGE